MIGLGCLGLGFVFLVVWSMVWMVAAQEEMNKIYKFIGEEPFTHNFNTLKNLSSSWTLELAFLPRRRHAQFGPWWR